MKIVFCFSLFALSKCLLFALPAQIDQVKIAETRDAHRETKFSFPEETDALNDLKGYSDHDVVKSFFARKKGDFYITSVLYVDLQSGLVKEMTKKVSIHQWNAESDSMNPNEIEGGVLMNQAGEAFAFNIETNKWDGALVAPSYRRYLLGTCINRVKSQNNSTIQRLLNLQKSYLKAYIATDKPDQATTAIKVIESIEDLAQPIQCSINENGKEAIYLIQRNKLGFIERYEKKIDNTVVELNINGFDTADKVALQKDQYGKPLDPKLIDSLQPNAMGKTPSVFGFSILKENNQIKVHKIFKEFPVELAGLLEEDEILSVNEIDASHYTQESFVKFMKEKEEISLAIKRVNGERKIIQISQKRALQENPFDRFESMFQP